MAKDKNYLNIRNFINIQLNYNNESWTKQLTHKNITEQKHNIATTEKVSGRDKYINNKTILWSYIIKKKKKKKKRSLFKRNLSALKDIYDQVFSFMYQKNTKQILIFILS